MPLDDAFETLSDTGMWMEAGAVMIGFLAPTVARNLIEPNTGFDVPDELYGVLVVGLMQYSPAYVEETSMGGALYTIDKLLERFGLKQTVTSIGGGA